MNSYNIWNKWDKLKSVMLGSCYPIEYYKPIKNQRIRDALMRITEETLEDLDHYDRVLKDFGCKVIRPALDHRITIEHHLSASGAVSGNQGIPRAPLQPRDGQLVAGNRLVATNTDHPGIMKSLIQYNNNINRDLIITNPINNHPVFKKSVFDEIRVGDHWGTYNDYLEPDYFDTHKRVKFEIVKNWQGVVSIVEAPCVTLVGKDVYVDTLDSDWRAETKPPEIAEATQRRIAEVLGDSHRINTLNVGGHSDGCFHTIKEGAILSLFEIQTYEDTFPGWEVCYLPNQSWSKVKGFLDMKDKVNGKWWVPGEEDNDEFTEFVETWLNDWVGFAEESVFDVNVLVLDEHHVCVNNMNPTVIEFLKKHKMEPVHIPWRHRYFWDGGLHCITLDLEREGVQEDYFPDRTSSVIDSGF